MTGSPFCVLGWEDQVHALESLDLSEPWAHALESWGLSEPWTHALGLYAYLLPKVPAFFKNCGTFFQKVHFCSHIPLLCT